MIATPTAQEEWETYRKICFGLELLPKTQERECSLAFYAGMISGITALMTISISESPEAEQCTAIDELLKSLGAACKLANLVRRESGVPRMNPEE